MKRGPMPHFNMMFELYKTKDITQEELEKYNNLENYEVTFDLTKEMCLSDNLDDFLTPKCYELIK